jgi:hypothetical protein
VIPENPLGTLTVRPAFDSNDPEDPDYLRLYKVTIEETNRRIHRLAFGITTSGPPANPVFGGCTAPVAGAFPLPIQGCTPNGDLGSTVFQLTIPPLDDPTSGVATYTAGPDTGGTFVPNTLYVSLQGADGASPASLTNAAGGSKELGKIRFSEDTATPQITFTGADLLPGYSPGGQVVPSNEGDIAVENISLLNRFDADEDLDGDGVGDDSDNCVLTQNGGEGGQQDSGGVAVVDPDDIGDTCQCGDGGGDGIVGFVSGTEEDDVVDCQNVLALLPGELPSDPEAAKCQVTVGEQFSIVDLVILEIEADLGNSGLPDTPSRLQACGPATKLQTP